MKPLNYGFAQLEFVHILKFKSYFLNTPKTFPSLLYILHIHGNTLMECFLPNHKPLNITEYENHRHTRTRNP